jgi:sucrose phosphorylase
MTDLQQIQDHLIALYGPKAGQKTWTTLQKRLEEFKTENPILTTTAPDLENPLTERDVILITYGDQIKDPKHTPLETLRTFLKSHLADAISAVHILPFYPYTSDDGFSVSDYQAVDPNLGSWDDILRIGGQFQLMFDAVLNHISRASAWFQGFLEGTPPFTEYFIAVDPQEDLSMVVRPRALPLLTQVETANGEKHVWTTFSEDQIDLNYAEPQVLLEILDTLLLYVTYGAQFIRLDAIAYLWKEIGTPCIHLPQTHRVVKLIRAVLDYAAPGTVIITETNVPHKDNISYFGEPDPVTGRYDEAQMVYQFPLAPLALHTFQTGDARALSVWAAGLDTPGETTTFFNFIASHDGIGVNPARGLLEETEIQAIVEKTLAHGGQVSYKTNPDGSQSVYELNITLYDALNDPQYPTPGLDSARFIASQALMLSLAGVPGIYVHSLFGSQNCQGCFRSTGRARSINREKFSLRELGARLADPTSLSHTVFSAYHRLLVLRRSERAFHPQAAQTILPTDGPIFGLIRQMAENDALICLINVSAAEHTLSLDLATNSLPLCGRWRDIISQEEFEPTLGHLHCTLGPFQVLWLKPAG